MYLVAWHQDKSVLVFITFKLIKFFVVALRSYFCSRFSNQIAKKVESKLPWILFCFALWWWPQFYIRQHQKGQCNVIFFWFDQINCFHFLLNEMTKTIKLVFKIIYFHIYSMIVSKKILNLIQKALVYRLDPFSGLPPTRDISF